MTAAKKFTKRSRGRFVAAVAAVAMAGTVAACSSGNSPTASAPGNTAAKVSGNTKVKGTLKIITWVNAPSVQAFNTIDKNFEKANPGVTVKLQTAADVSGPYAQLQQTTVQNNSADIVTNVLPIQPMPPKPTKSNMSNWQYWMTDGLFSNLTGQSFLKGLTSSALQDETYQGKTYGVESGSYQEGVFYNKAIFSKYHLSVPTTYNQFMSELATLKSKGVTPLWDGLGNVGGAYLQFLYWPLMVDLWYPKAPGGNLVDGFNKGTVKWTDPEFVKVLTEEKAIAKYLEPNFTGVPWEGMPGAFAAGKSAMLLDGSWDLAAIQSANPKIQVGFFPLPGSNVAADNKPFIAGNLNLSILSHSKNQQLALKYLNYFTSPSQYSIWVKDTGISPSLSSGHYSGFAAQVLGSQFGKGVNQGVIMPTLPAQGSYWDTQTNWPTLQLKMVQGTYTPAQVAKMYQAGWPKS